VNIRDGAHHDQVLDHLADYVRSHGHDAGVRQLRAFMVDYLRCSIGALPAGAHAIFAIAEEMHDRALADAELIDARHRARDPV